MPKKHKQNGYYKAKPSPPGYLGSVHIAGDEIEVHRVKELATPHGEKCDGLYYPAFGKIEIEAHLTPRAEKQTLLHELWHAIVDKYGIALSSKKEEAMANPVGNGLEQALRPWLPKKNLRPWGRK